MLCVGTHGVESVQPSGKRAFSKRAPDSRMRVQILPPSNLLPSTRLVWMNPPSSITQPTAASRAPPSLRLFRASLDVRRCRTVGFLPIQGIPPAHGARHDSTPDSIDRHHDRPFQVPPILTTLHSRSNLPPHKQRQAGSGGSPFVSLSVDPHVPRSQRAFDYRPSDTKAPAV